MFRIKTAQDEVVYRTDIHSCWQIGRGWMNPKKHAWDGVISCSVVIDRDVVRKEFEPTTSPPELITDEAFWSTEFTPGKAVPSRLC